MLLALVNVMYHTLGEHSNDTLIEEGVPQVKMAVFDLI